MWSRRQFLSRTGLGLAGTAGTCLGFPGDAAPLREVRDAIPDGSASKGMIDNRTEEGIRRGLAFLAQRRSGDG